MDKNNLTGVFLISALLMVYLLFFAPDPEELAQSPEEPATPKATASETLKEEQTKASELIAQLPDSVLQEKYGAIALAMRGEASKLTLENDEVEITFDTQGGKVSAVKLKNYVTNAKKELVLLDAQSSYMQELTVVNNQRIDLNQLYYTAIKTDSTIAFTARDTTGAILIQKNYILPSKGFVLNYEVELAEPLQTSPASGIQFYWKNNLKKVEKDLNQSRMRSTVNFYTVEDELDYPSESSQDYEEIQVEQPVRWVSMKQKFFNAAILTDSAFSTVTVASQVDENDTTVVKTLEATLQIPLENGSTSGTNVRFYFGPNDYDVCKTVAPAFERNVYLGWSFFSTINLYLIIPLFEFLELYITNYGVIILILVFIVKSMLFPLTYRSYVSMAKMKVLKPEMDEIREKHGDDQMAAQQETMKLYRQVGVSPLSGCIPVLAQMPIFLAMYNFFPNAIQLRQQSFLWASDLSSYDSILDLPFSIPMYGSHVSLFTLLMAGSTIVYTYFNNQMSSATMQGPMKNIGYITPVIFMVFLNSFSAGLTYYYFVSNLITIFQQLIIRRFVDEEKIRNILMQNKKKNANKKKSRFQQRLDDAMKQAQDGKAKTAKTAIKPKDYKNEVEGDIKMLSNNGKAQVEVQIKNNSSQSLLVEYEIPFGNKSVTVGAGKVKRQRFQLKNVEEKDLKLNILKATAKV